MEAKYVAETSRKMNVLGVIQRKQKNVSQKYVNTTFLQAIMANF